MRQPTLTTASLAVASIFLGCALNASAASHTAPHNNGPSPHFYRYSREARSGPVPVVELRDSSGQTLSAAEFAIRLIDSTKGADLTRERPNRTGLVNAGFYSPLDLPDVTAISKGLLPGQVKYIEVLKKPTTPVRELVRRGAAFRESGKPGAPVLERVQAGRLVSGQKLVSAPGTPEGYSVVPTDLPHLPADHPIRNSMDLCSEVGIWVSLDKNATQRALALIVIGLYREALVLKKDPEKSWLILWSKRLEGEKLEKDPIRMQRYRQLGFEPLELKSKGSDGAHEFVMGASLPKLLEKLKEFETHPQVTRVSSAFRIDRYDPKLYDLVDALDALQFRRYDVILEGQRQETPPSVRIDDYSGRWATSNIAIRWSAATELEARGGDGLAAHGIDHEMRKDGPPGRMTRNEAPFGMIAQLLRSVQVSGLEQIVQSISKPLRDSALHDLLVDLAHYFATEDPTSTYVPKLLIGKYRRPLPDHSTDLSELMIITRNPPLLGAFTRLGFQTTPLSDLVKTEQKKLHGFNLDVFERGSDMRANGYSVVRLPIRALLERARMGSPLQPRVRLGVNQVLDILALPQDF